MAQHRGALTAAVGILALSCCILSNRYYTSAAFERPLHLSLLTLLFTGLALQLPHRPKWPSEPPQCLTKASLPFAWAGPSPVAGPAPSKPGSLARLRRLCPRLTALVGCIAARCLLFGLALETSQCAWPGIEALLPLFSLVCELVFPKLVKTAKASPGKLSHYSQPARSPPAITYALISLAWAISAILALSSSRLETGTVCPADLSWARATICAQVAICALDAAALSYGAHLRHCVAQFGPEDAAKLAKSLVVAASLLVVLCFPLWIGRFSPCLTLSLGSLDLRDLVIDSVLASAALVSAFSLLADLHPTSVALLVSETSLFSYWYLDFNFASGHRTWGPSLDSSATLFLSAAVFAALLWCFGAFLSHAQQTRTSRLHLWLLALHIGLVLFGLVNSTLLSALPQPTISQAVQRLVASARSERADWDSQAASSNSLSEAVAEYKRRHGMPPPPNFDKWYAYAIQSSSLVIDDFAQIHGDILPFWGVKPSKIREKTRRLTSYAHAEMGGLGIRNGSIYQSPFIPPTHRWMTDMVAEMIEPFVQWLPDMVLPINLADECRVSVPFHDMEALKARAKTAISRVGVTDMTVKFRKATRDVDGARGWPESALAKPMPWDEVGASRPRKSRRDFVQYHKRQIFYDWIASTCPPDSAARSSRWWDWSLRCSACLAPHSLVTREGAIVANKTLAHDLCHQPDVARLDGFTLSPTVLMGSSSLVPVFSQSRVGGFSDILIPSPWDFEGKSAHVDAEDVPWSDKINGLYWRGSSTDGFAAHGSWAGFLRARFVHEAYQRASGLGKATQLSINVSFVGDMQRCRDADCVAELTTFRQWATMTAKASPRDQGASAPKKRAAGLPSPLPFKESWHFRHLMDMDGAGFSGRFLSFLRSRSLVYRAALFKTWYDERLVGWHDYVPVDVRLGSGLWSALYYLAGVSEAASSGIVGDGRGLRTAQRIAEQGRETASGVLRREDMRVYMFRLLLEWGRVTNDERESLVYHGMG